VTLHHQIFLSGKRDTKTYRVSSMEESRASATGDYVWKKKDRSNGGVRTKRKLPQDTFLDDERRDERREKEKRNLGRAVGSGLIRGSVMLGWRGLDSQRFSKKISS